MYAEMSEVESNNTRSTIDAELGEAQVGQHSRTQPASELPDLSDSSTAIDSVEIPNLEITSEVQVEPNFPVGPDAYTLPSDPDRVEGEHGKHLSAGKVLFHSTFVKCF